MSDGIIALLIASALACGLMTLLWVVQQRTGNAGIVDVGWSGTIPVLAVTYSFWYETYSIPRVWIAVAFIVVWGSRLAWHIHRRSSGKPEDARYRDLRVSWGRAAPWKFLVFFQFQAVAAVLFSMPFLLIARDSTTEIRTSEEIGFVLMWLALLGENTADQQLSRFKRNTSMRGNVCQEGLWKYSRHPNYFFEWVVWVAVAVYAWPSPYGWAAIACPVLMLFFLFKLTGIPATEAQAIRSKGDAYRTYQDTTSVFIPWFNRTAKSK